MQGNGASRSDEQGVVFQMLPTLVTAAHELKNPLSLIRQLSLSLKDDANMTDEQRRMLRQIMLTSERALRLTTTLSRSSRLEDSLFELEPLNPQQLCEEVAHELTPLYAEHGRVIRVAPRRKPLLAVANRDLLRRIMLNFGDNALHYSDPTLPVELRASELTKSGAVRMLVRDHGPSIPTKTWNKLQTQLGTGAQVLHARPESSGLGLYVAGQFAQCMNGQIGAIRHRDGVSFYVDIDASLQLSLL